VIFVVAFEGAVELPLELDELDELLELEEDELEELLELEDDELELPVDDELDDVTQIGPPSERYAAQKATTVVVVGFDPEA